MAGELGARERYALPALTFQPINPSSYFSRAMPEIVTDTSKLSKAAGMKSIMEAIAKMPQQGMQLYADTKKLDTDLATRREYEKALNDPTGKDGSHAPLSDFKVSGGTVTLDREDPEIRELKIAEAKARKSYWDSRAAGNDPDTDPNPLFGTPETKAPGGMLDYDETKPTTGNPIIDNVLKDVKKGGKREDSCWDWAQCVYKDAGAGEGQVIYNRHPGHDPVGTLDYNKITPGSWLWVHNGNTTDKHGEHSVIFMDWLDKDKGVARVASGSAGREPRIETYDFGQKEIRRITLPEYTGAQPQEPGGLRSPVTETPETLAGSSEGLKPVIDGSTVIEDNPVFRIEEKGQFRYTIPKRLPKGAKGKLAEYIKTERLPQEQKDKQTPSENALDRAVIARGGNPLSMTMDEKEAYLKTEVPLKPSERLSAIRDLKNTYHENPATITLFGKGQMPGIDTIKEKLDALVNEVGGDFSKLSPTQQRTFVYQFNKLNDPNSAVLLQEYKAAADTLGILDKAGLALDKAIKGEQLTPEQAQDIYNTINITHEQMKGLYLQDVAAVIEEAGAMKISPTRVGIPKKATQWLEESLGEKDEPSSINRSEPKTPAPSKPPVPTLPKPTNPMQALQKALETGINPDGTPMSEEDKRAVQAALKLKAATQ